MIERLNNEIQRRTHGALPSALLRLISHRGPGRSLQRRHVGERRYLSEGAIAVLADSTEIRKEVATLALLTA
jgi:hypothetical protein